MKLGRTRKPERRLRAKGKGHFALTAEEQVIRAMSHPDDTLIVGCLWQQRSGAVYRITRVPADGDNEHFSLVIHFLPPSGAAHMRWMATAAHLKADCVFRGHF